MPEPERHPHSRERLPTSPISYKSVPYVKAVATLTRLTQKHDVSVLIEGESGTGKTTIARELHCQSDRARGPFIAVPLSGVDDGVVSSELFGHVAGAFTDARMSRAGAFASANGGTLFLDEIGKASLIAQRRLLDVIDRKELRQVGADRSVAVDVRVIAASNVELATLADRGEFLRDLYARLEPFRVRLPPLRERRADIPLLVRDIVARHAPSCGYEQPPDVDPALMAAFSVARWPGNLRELDGAIHRLLIEADGATTLTLALCTDYLAYLRGGRPRGNTPTKSEMGHAAEAAKGAKGKAARLLGVHRTTYWRHEKRLRNRDP